MRFHRSRTWYFEPLVTLLVMLAVGWIGLLFRRDLLFGIPAGLPVMIVVREALTLVAAVAVATILGLRLLVSRRFEFVVDDHGLHVHTARMTADFPWDDVESAVVDDLRILVTRTGGGEPREVLALSQVRETADQVAAAFAQYAGSRFADVRTRR